MDRESISITCRKCERTFAMRSILQHVDRSDCRSTYSDMQLSSLQAHSNDISANKQKIKKAQRYLATKSEVSRKRIEKYNPLQRHEQHIEKYNPLQRHEQHVEKYNPIQRHELHIKKYNPLQRHEKYVNNSVAISLKYYKRRDIIAKRYNKELRRKKYKAIITRIIKERKQLKDDKDSEAGQVLSKICYKLFADFFDRLESGEIDFALEMQEEYIEDFEDIDQIFEKELWVTDIFHFSCDCERVNNSAYSHSSAYRLSCKDFEPKSHKKSKTTNLHGRKHWCIKHIDDSQWGEVIETAMDKRLQEETYKRRLEDAKIDVNREMKLTYGLFYSPPNLPSLHFDAAKKSENKAFKTLFLKEHKDIYEKAYRFTISKWQKTEEKKRHRRFLNRRIRILRCLYFRKNN